MLVVLALLTFALFATLDYVLHYRNARQTAAAPTTAVEAEPTVETTPAMRPVYVAGYELPETLHYHRGHTWAKVVSPDTAVIGIDDFARKLLGQVKTVRAPRIGRWVRQGAEVARFEGENRMADVVSPVEGEVIAVNHNLAREPEAVSEDPYGRGWLYKVRASNLGANMRNLLDGTMARRFTEDAREQLELRLMALSGSVLQDGGEPAEDFADHLEDDEWRSLVGEFLLT